ncbi:hypothetical protein CHLNCDRAFT_140968 [Chlorella variabilis]|uniref:Uncharacterized protein n=1 Tax=Chlorella variabilis TaxID=554065 RepID=E1ZRX3_CHLVA|nr:hypothetical protein CHLNCDRAFT_140968 [Chlorella variabilis]EFN51414.1 hypothetical protein CHLNCDRAFT_140968 [Chlorella variabilis]|eukprot:XP_005843516.1 hypothetical protein CHLNCDRAFT_140968 [Chlorella variabilis]
MAALLAACSSATALSSKAAIARQPFAAAAVRLPARPAARAMQAVAMAKPTKAGEFRGLSNEEIDSAVQEAKRDMFSMRIKFAKREASPCLPCASACCVPAPAARRCLTPDALPVAWESRQRQRLRVVVVVVDWKPSDYKALKRRIAQLLTVRRERELAAGMDRRASKAGERRKLVDAGLGKFAS